jgi:hypothetical protein
MVSSPSNAGGSVYHRALGEERLNPFANEGDQRVAIVALHARRFNRLSA